MKKTAILIFQTLLLSSLIFSQLYAQCTNGDCDNGNGRLLYANGDRYLGEFKNGVSHGRGAYYYANGDLYKGEFKNGERHGYGTMQWYNGDKYIGEYVKSVRHGEGTYIFADGRKKRGVFEKGKLVTEYVEEEPTIIAATPTESINENPQEVSTENTATTTENVSSPIVYVENTNKNQLAALEGIIAEEKRLALIIGNSSYQSVAPLKNPKNDAEDMTEKLRKMGFDVWMYQDLTQKEMKRIMREFGEQLKTTKAVGLFFYAGHGLQADGRNYLVPVDANIQKDLDIELESVDLNRVLIEMEYAENPMNIVILDACRDNPFENPLKRNQGFTQVKSVPVNSVIAFATSPGTTASDGAGKNGLYTQEFLANLDKFGTAKLEDVFKQVRASVRKASGGKQIPWETSSIETDFYFKK